jgi:hypothetical protein
MQVQQCTQYKPVQVLRRLDAKGDQLFSVVVDNGVASNVHLLEQQATSPTVPFEGLRVPNWLWVSWEMTDDHPLSITSC